MQAGTSEQIAKYRKLVSAGLGGVSTNEVDELMNQLLEVGPVFYRPNESSTDLFSRVSKRRMIIKCITHRLENQVLHHGCSNMVIGNEGKEGIMWSIIGSSQISILYYQKVSAHDVTWSWVS